MPDAPDPPRKVYGFKAREFDRANAARPEAADAVPPPPAAVIPAASESTPSEKIDVHALIRAGAGDGPALGTNKVANRDNEVHTMLRGVFQRDQAAGHFDLKNLDDSHRRRRLRNYWIAMAAVNIPLGLVAVLAGPGAAIPFACALAGMGFFSARLTWNTFFLRTHYRD